jgi:hypothetical protein
LPNAADPRRQGAALALWTFVALALAGSVFSINRVVHEGTFSYDATTISPVDVDAIDTANDTTTKFASTWKASHLPFVERPGMSATPRARSVATKAAGLGDEAAGLLGNADDVVVLGRQADTAIAKGWDRHVVLDTPNWSLELNDAFIRGAIDQGRRIYLASPTTGNLVQTAGQFAGQPTIYARELNMLRQAGYVRVGDYMVPG